MADSDTRSESPLSDIGSDAFTEEKYARSRSPSNASDLSDASDDSATPSTSTPRNMDIPPAKRRRTGLSTYDHPTPLSSSLNPPRSPTGSISSDSSGSVPTSPSFAHLGPTHPLSTVYAAAQANPNDPESADYFQVTRCQWTDCAEPEQGNMDRLVQHITDVHIPPRQKKYFCEWEGCSRKSMQHTSAYALKAHMRSHTKEKPFMCALPECDRSFTRSDALAKHMRTVHETEALRPSDPVPRGHTGGISQGTSGPFKKLKLTMGKSSNGEKKHSIELPVPPLPTLNTLAALSGEGPIKAEQNASRAVLSESEADDPGLKNAVDMDKVSFQLPITGDYYPPDVFEGMDDYECSLPPSQYFRLLRRQLRWAEQESSNLHRELADSRATTDNPFGHPVKRTASGDIEKIGDDVRKEEWNVAELMVDKILLAEVNQVISAYTGKGGVDGQAGSNSNPWQMVKGLEGLIGTPI